MISKSGSDLINSSRLIGQHQIVHVKGGLGVGLADKAQPVERFPFNAAILKVVKLFHRWLGNVTLRFQVPRLFAPSAALTSTCTH